MLSSLLDDDSSRWEQATVEHVRELTRSRYGAVYVGRLEKKDEEGHIPVSRAIGHGASADVVKLLFEICPEASIQWRDKEFGGTLLHLAACNNAAVIPYLLSAHPSLIGVKTVGGSDTALDIAKFSENKEAEAYLQNHEPMPGSAPKSQPGIIPSCPDSCVWYFSFGGNMSDETLKRRNIHPTKSIGCCLPGYKLTFTYRGYVGVEPVFADITVLKEGELNDSTVLVVEGVVHCITKEEMALLDGYEGEGVAYERIEVDCVPLGGGQSSRFKAQAYRAIASCRVEDDGSMLPSTRYLKLLVDGAVARKLSTEYCRKLRAQKSFGFDGFAMPEMLYNFDVSISQEELSRFVFYKSESPKRKKKSRKVLLSMGGYVFNVSSQVSSRAMLQNMAGEMGGTAFAMKMWRAAHGNSSGLHLKDVEENVDFIQKLGKEERQYVAAWTCHLASHYEFVGVVRTVAGEAKGAAKGKNDFDKLNVASVIVDVEEATLKDMENEERRAVPLPGHARAKFLRRSEWMGNNSSTTCANCNTKFTLFTRRHHCRKCGQLVCDNCSLTRLRDTSDTTPKKLLRVCDYCVDKMLQT
jgi:hypothetical protein